MENPASSKEMATRINIIISTLPAPEALKTPLKEMVVLLQKNAYCEGKQDMIEKDIADIDAILELYK